MRMYVYNFIVTIWLIWFSILFVVDAVNISIKKVVIFNCKGVIVSKDELAKTKKGSELKLCVNFC